MRFVVCVLALAACRVKDPPPITEEWVDLFERDGVGPNWLDTSDGEGYRIEAGTLSARGGKNRPLWLRRKLPRDVRVEFTAWSDSPEGDLKVELMGDGRSYDPDGGAYQASGYVLIHGGWSNSKSMIARQDEHGDQLVERTGPRVVRGQRYAWKIERRGKTLSWWLDGATEPFLTYDDPAPLSGDGNAYLAINNWQTDTHFDDLRITPL